MKIIASFCSILACFCYPRSLLCPDQRAVKNLFILL